MLVENLGVEADQFLGREGVEISADGIHRSRDVFRATRLRALEEHVLNEVGQAILLLRLTSRSGVDPEPNRHGSDMRHPFCNDTETVGKNGRFDIALGREDRYHVLGLNKPASIK